MKILGIDFGKKRLGLALYDTSVGVAVPFGLFEDASRLSEIVRTERVDRIVIGLPLGLDGKENDVTALVRAFGDGLKKTTGIPIDFFDERFSSVAADRFDTGVSRDEKAAMVILEGWIERNKNDT